MPEFILQELANKCQRDKYYRLELTPVVDLSGDHDPSMPFQTIKVIFSQYKPEYQTLEAIKNIRTKNRLKPFPVEYPGVVIKADVTNQVFLKPGTVWKNGKCVWEPSDAINISIEDATTIDTSYASWLTTRDKKKKGLMLPFVQGADKVTLVEYPMSMAEGREISVLIPTTEIIRYYFSGSTYFTRELFNGALDGFNRQSDAGALSHQERTEIARKLFYDFDYDPIKQSVYVWLKRHCYDSDAVMIARALAEPDAMKAMTYIYSSLTLEKAKDDPSEVCPRSKLPFTDRTDMEVQGQWLQPKEGENVFTHFLVRTIESCSHTLPFKKIDIESADSYGANNGKTQAKPSDVPRKKGKDHGTPPELTQGQKPTKDVDPKELDFMMQRFSQLDDVEINKVKKVSDPDKEAKYQREEEVETSNEGSTLPGDYKDDNNVQPWQNRIVDAEPIPISNRLKEVSDAVQSILDRRPDLSAVALPPNATDGRFPFGYCRFERPMNKGAGYNWNAVGDRDRRALLLLITNDQGKSAGLLEIESREGKTYSLYVFKGHRLASDHYREAKRVIADIAWNSGNRIASDVLFGTEALSLKHITSGSDSFGERIERALNVVLSD
ncbi:MAG: hypothetical protein RI556_04310 [Hydrogenovibrio sp.]|uniref:hypothetical protein n=1 Tax=Hydrogenovibrio sp. TaxID=2065821 RepID=UPI002870690D|nr:hypothetical protein [Hydrogenovibrio sp.]MDR9498377.1 hypothetical protein [Hydrogenovibrio sp.]